MRACNLLALSASPKGSICNVGFNLPQLQMQVWAGEVVFKSEEPLVFISEPLDENPGAGPVHVYPSIKVRKLADRKSVV